MPPELGRWTYASSFRVLDMFIIMRVNASGDK
jgi:hypothetical protein